MECVITVMRMGTVHGTQVCNSKYNRAANLTRRLRKVCVISLRTEYCLGLKSLELKIGIYREPLHLIS